MQGLKDNSVEGSSDVGSEEKLQKGFMQDMREQGRRYLEDVKGLASLKPGPVNSPFRTGFGVEDTDVIPSFVIPSITQTTARVWQSVRRKHRILSDRFQSWVSRDGKTSAGKQVLLGKRDRGAERSEGGFREILLSSPSSLKPLLGKSNSAPTSVGHQHEETYPIAENSRFDQERSWELSCSEGSQAGVGDQPVCLVAGKIPLVYDCFIRQNCFNLF